MRWCWILLFVATACASTWERHQAQLAADEANGRYARAAADERWLIDNALYEAPAAERSPAAEAERYLRLAKLAVKAGHLSVAVEALRQTLATDAHQAPAVRNALEHFPVPAEERERLKQEFAWNINALAPGADAFIGERSDAQCWSYRVREVRIRHRRTVRTADGLQRQVTYDARPWIFHAHSHQWQMEAAWMNDAGTEVELANGPEQPRFRALTAAEHEFFSDESIPPCHRSGWQGPYDPNGTIFVAARLPVTESKSAR